MSTLMPLCRLSVLRAIGCNLSAVGSLSSIIGQSDDNEKQQHPMKKLNMGAMVKFASLSDTGPTPIVKDVLHSIQMQKLKEELRDESSIRLHISEDEFVQRALHLDAASNREEAIALLSAMHKTGDVLRHVDVVYLRAAHVAEIVMMALPGGREDARLKLSKIEEELKELRNIQVDAEEKAMRITRRFLFAGGCILVAQFFTFIWLTWFELSWDVMEPFGFILQLFYQLVAYTYFLSTNGKVFDLQPFKETWTDRFKSSIIKNKPFDAARFQYLTRLKERYERHLTHALSDKMA